MSRANPLRDHRDEATRCVALFFEDHAAIHCSEPGGHILVGRRRGQERRAVGGDLAHMVGRLWHERGVDDGPVGAGRLVPVLVERALDEVSEIEVVGTGNHQ